jgi:hypothetical protein
VGTSRCSSSERAFELRQQGALLTRDGRHEGRVLLLVQVVPPREMVLRDTHCGAVDVQLKHHVEWLAIYAMGEWHPRIPPPDIQDKLSQPSHWLLLEMYFLYTLN